jgi:peroxiredoxin
MRSSLFALAGGLLLSSFFSAPAAEQNKFEQSPSGLAGKVGGTMPRRLVLSAGMPAVRKLPPDVTAPKFATLRFGARDSMASIWVLLDEPEGKPPRLFVDSNRNGDLSDDRPPQWSPTEYDSTAGNGWVQYTGNATISVKYGNDDLDWTLQFYRFDPKDKAHAADKDALFVYADYYREGMVELENNRSFRALIADPAGTGDYRTPEARLYLDLNNDGKYDPRTEGFYVARPFTLFGATYKIVYMTASGNTFQLERARVDLTGPRATPFRVTTIDGKTVNFPADYKGKLVLLHFWATWHGPSVRETPNLLKAYNKHHAQGLEMLSISLDKVNQSTNVTLFGRQQRVSWPQVYDGKYWDTPVAKLYNVRELTAGDVLLDADAGIILATGAALTGQRLDRTLNQALSGRKKP